MSSSIFKVSIGEIGIDCVYVLQKTDSVYVWVINCTQKYPMVYGVSSDLVIIGLSEYTPKSTKRQDTNAKTTVQILGIPDSSWHTFVEAGRYEIFCCTTNIHPKQELDELGWNI